MEATSITQVGFYYLCFICGIWYVHSLSLYYFYKRLELLRTFPGLNEFMLGTFTLSNLGMFGVDRFDAILPPGQLSEQI